MPEAVLSRIEALRQDLIALQRELVARPAVGPTNEGTGEQEKADFLRSRLSEILGVEITVLNAPDDRVPCGYRPNVAAILPGFDRNRTFWIIGHTDVVPPGDTALWETEPFEVVVDGDRMIGRGTEDNHQGILSSLLLLKALTDTKTTPPMNLGLLFVADEETGSAFGMRWVMENRADLFRSGDLFLVPDVGGPDGSRIEIAEKGQLWIKITVLGRQCHASRPALGLNSLTAAADMILRLEALDQTRAKRPGDPLFSPPRTTITPTRKDANVPNVNTLPGRDVFYVDCRILPGEGVDQLLKEIEALGQEVAAERGVNVEVEVVQREESPATSADSDIARRVFRAVSRVYEVDPRFVGVGGGTVAAFLRRAGHDVVAWATLQEMAHQPNEYALIGSTLKDAQVMARALFDKA
ncbi:MAG: M20 family metallo-hydrolase [Deltaproteobacteria bacterium]|nr:M20 family metallo-hydrolase [Deltaproteobacteria bacterium]